MLINALDLLINAEDLAINKYSLGKVLQETGNSMP